MKNDFDFIKEKIDSAGVNAPSDMGASFALEQIADTSPKPVEVAKPKRRWKAVAVAAAAFVMVAAIGVAIGVGSHIKDIVNIPVIGSTEQPDDPAKISGEKLTLAGGLSLIRFKNRDEVERAVESIRTANGYYEMKDYDYGLYEAEAAADSIASGSASNAASSSGSATGGSGSHSETYKQVEGVDEADIIKTDGRYIYCVEPYESKIVIFSAEGEASERVAKIDVERTMNASATPDETDDFDYEAYYFGYYTTVSDIFLSGDRLIAICNMYSGDGDKTAALVYDISDIDSITLLDSYAQSGYYTSSRMIGDTLYTVSSFYPYKERLIPCCGNTYDTAELAADCIYSYEEPESESFLIVSAYDTRDFNARTETKAILGAAEDIYCNEDHLYIYATDYGHGSYNYYWGYASEDVKSRILKVDLTDSLSFTAYSEVEGYIDDQYALDESGGYLRVATTSLGDNGLDVNNLFILDESLNTVGSVTGFAENESIKAVRYVGDTAYVITYEQTDPLFVIDLSDPTAPEILGEVKISGFSTMLVPIDENTILGLGYYTQEEDYTDLEVQEGFKLALFDVSDKANPQVLDSISYIDYYSEVMYEPKTLVYNPERGDYVIPLNYHHYDYYNYNNDLYRGGMLNFKVEDGKIVPITHYEADYHEDVERCVYIGDTIYMTYNDGELQLDSVNYQ